MGKQKLDNIYKEVAHDLNIPKKLVRTVIKGLFKEIATALILRGKPILIRKFLKIVIATRTIKKLTENYQEFKTKMK